LILPSAYRADASWHRDHRPDCLLSDRTAAIVFALLELGSFPTVLASPDFLTTTLPRCYPGFLLQSYWSQYESNNRQRHRGNRRKINAPAYVKHPKLISWIADIAALTKPDNIVWCDGTQEEYDRLCAQMVASGTMKTE
jgi:hypothetical protein